MSRAEVELVIARVEEDITWSDPVASLRTVYRKGAPPAAGEVCVVCVCVCVCVWRGV